MNEFMARDTNKPLTFQLPDGDVVPLVTWEYITSKLESNLSTTIDAIEEINKDLNIINNRIGEWLKESE